MARNTGVTSARTTRTATAAPAKANPQPAAAAPAVSAAAAPNGRGSALDLDALAGGATAVQALPKASRGPSSSSAMSDLVMRSFTEGKPFALPAVAGDAEKVLKSLQSAVRRAASLVGLGVTIRHEVTPAGVVVTFQGKERRDRAAK